MGSPKHDSFDPERDVLRARFTVWLDTTFSRASTRYRKQMQDKLAENAEVLSLDEVPEDYLSDSRDPYWYMENAAPDFMFEEERLADAFAKLPLMRKEVLRLLFVEQMKPREIAERLHCSEAFVSVQKMRAIHKLRLLLGEGGERTYEK